MQRHMILWRSQMPGSRHRARGERNWATPGPVATGAGLAAPVAALLVVGLLAAPILGMVWAAG